MGVISGRALREGPLELDAAQAEHALDHRAERRAGAGRRVHGPHLAAEPLLEARDAGRLLAAAGHVEAAEVVEVEAALLEQADVVPVQVAIRAPDEVAHPAV